MAEDTATVINDTFCPETSASGPIHVLTKAVVNAWLCSLEKRNDTMSRSSHSSEDRDDPAAEHLAIRYKQTVLSRKGGPRCMSAIVKDPVSMEVPERSLVEMYKAAKSGELPIHKQQSIIILRNKKPEWDDSASGYVLDFRGRVTETSTKNFQLSIWKPGMDEPEGPVVCQFGRKEGEIFALDFAYPLNVVQAFMIALSSMDMKLCYAM